ncbi:MAG: ABC transporter substrate-binding protein [Candidatus Bipolaricaulis anaerobius]|nr:ABC transporter substrate-binding protein [Candidatus Bipolaricaulis anaerobius]
MKAFGVGFMIVVLAVGGWAQGLTVVDQAGRTVEIAAVPTRVASAFAVATAYVYSLGAGDLVVGARYLGIPDSPIARGVMARIDPQWEGKGFPGDVTVETIVALKADLVVAGVRHQKLAELLGDVGIPTVLYAAETFDAVRAATELTGKILGREEAAARLVALFDEVVAEVASAVPADEGGPRVLFVGTEPLRVAAAGMYQAQQIALAGGRTAAEDLAGTSWQNVSPEQFLLWNPDVIVIASYGAVVPADYLGDPVFQGITAVQTGRVYKMPQLLFAWDNPIPESVLGIAWLAELLHPGTLPLTLGEYAARLYRDFYGVELTEEELASIIGP